MNIQEKIVQDMKISMKSGDRLVVDTLRMVRAAIKNCSIEKGRELSNEEVIDVLSNEVKKRKDSIDLYQKGNREDLVVKEKREIEIISSYLPEPLSSEELEKIVEDTISETGAQSLKDMGKVMGVVMGRVRGRAEGRTVQEVVKRMLS